MLEETKGGTSFDEYFERMAIAIEKIDKKTRQFQLDIPQDGVNEGIPKIESLFERKLRLIAQNIESVEESIKL